MYALLGISTADYARAEQAMLDIAHEAGITGWDLDRLLFHFSDHFLSAVGAGTVPAHAEGNEPDEERHTYTKGKSIMSNSGQHIARMPHDAGSAGPKWEIMYASFLKRRNTSIWGRKAEYAKALLREFNGRVPLAIVVDDAQRKMLCKKLFGASNDFNYVIYALGMGIYLGALRRDDEHLVVACPELM